MPIPWLCWIRKTRVSQAQDLIWPGEDAACVTGQRLKGLRSQRLPLISQFHSAPVGDTHVGNVKCCR
jgi:hypothetical protein